MLRYLFLFCGFVLVLASDCFGESSVELTPELAKKITIVGQLPDYPAAAWRQKMKGSGVFALNVDPETGLVTSVQIEKSTGLGILDASCLKTFKRWRFKPHTVRKLHIPVIFTKR